MQTERHTPLVSNGNAYDERHPRTLFLDQIPEDRSVQ